MKDYGDWIRRPDDSGDDNVGLALVLAAVLAVVITVYVICN